MSFAYLLARVNSVERSCGGHDAKRLEEKLSKKTLLFMDATSSNYQEK
jgi:hypothetical protein